MLDISGWESFPCLDDGRCSCCELDGTAADCVSMLWVAGSLA